MLADIDLRLSRPGVAVDPPCTGFPTILIRERKAAFVSKVQGKELSSGQATLPDLSDRVLKFRYEVNAKGLLRMGLAVLLQKDWVLSTSSTLLTPSKHQNWHKRFLMLVLYDFEDLTLDGLC
jgi:hypothetical protein